MDEAMKREPNSVSVLATKALESIGLLNKGSADLAAGKINSAEAADNLPVTQPALNVTRVTGLSALIASAGAAAIAIFNVDKSTDATGVVAAAYGSAGLIVAASLIAVAVILYADITARSRTAPTTPSATPSKTTDDPSSASEVKTQWDEAVKRLETANSGLKQATDRLGYSALWRDASGTTGMVSELSPPNDLRDEHSRLCACQGRIIEILEGLITNQSTATEDVGEIASHVRDMRQTLNNISTPEVS